MLGQFEEKGKIYTPVISKEPVEVMILTATQRIQGKVHIRHDERLKDQLDCNERYIAVTDAVVTSLDGVEVLKTNFLAVNHMHIIMISPLAEIDNPQDASHE